MKLQELLEAKATYELYGPNMLSVEVINFLFKSAIEAQEEGVEVDELPPGVASITPKPKRAAKKAE
jgi:hypothetical protein